MSQYYPGAKISVESSDTITAHAVVVSSGDRTCTFFATSSSNILGVCESLTDSGAAASVIMSGTAKVQCFASIAAGALVGPATAGSGKIQTVTANTSTSQPKTLGIALEAGSSDSSIEVALQIDNRSQGI